MSSRGQPLGPKLGKGSIMIYLGHCEERDKTFFFF